jgi:hypothetical protein
MPRAKKQPTYEYGIEITKPWSREMYAHNDKVLDIAKENIQTALDEAYAKWEPEAIIDSTDMMSVIAKEICGYGYGPGYENRDIYEDACRELNNASYHWMHEIYPYLAKIEVVEPLEHGFIGYSK